MKSDVQTLNPTRVKLTVEVPYDELRPSLDAAYRTIAGQVQIPGFRRGKVPPRIIDQRVGRGAVLEEAVNDALPRFYGQAVEDAKVRPLGQPQVEVTGVPDPAQGGELTFTVEVDVRPQVQLPDYDGLRVEVDDVTVEDSDVDEQLTGLRERFGTLLGVERPAQDGDFVSLDLSARIGEEEIDSVKGVSYQVGSGTMLAGLDEALAGTSAGETRTYRTPLAGGDREGQEADVTVTVQSVKERQLPELDDDFAQTASEFDTLEELRADVRGQVERVKRLEQGVQARDRLLEQLTEMVDVPVPDALVQAEVDSHLENEGRQQDEEHRAEVDAQTRAALRQQFLLDAVVEREDLSVAQPELVEYLVMAAQQYGMEPQEFAKAVDEGGQVPAMVSEVARRKALATVLERAQVVDASGRPVDLEALRPPAEEPGEQPGEGETSGDAGAEVAGAGAGGSAVGGDDAGAEGERLERAGEPS